MKLMIEDASGVLHDVIDDILEFDLRDKVHVAELVYHLRCVVRDIENG